jgi:hypothetical protein
MKYNNDSLNQAPDSDGFETAPFKKVTEPTVSVIPSLNRFIEDLRSGYRSGSRIDVQIDWAHGRMAISHSL